MSGARDGTRRARRVWAAGTALVLALALAGAATQLSTGSPDQERTYTAGAAILTVVEQPHAKGVLVTTGGWAYCQQLRALARRSKLTLLCGRFPKDGYVGLGLRARRHLDWGNAAYLRALAREAGALHDRVGGELLLVGVSYSGFGVATLASHHPEIRPDRLIVIDSYLDLAARRAAAGTGAIGREIDAETGGSNAALEERSARVDGLASLVATGTRLQVIWSIAPDERGQPVDTGAALLERRVRAARLGVDLPADRSCAGRSPSGGEIEVGVDHDQPVGSKLGVVRGQRRRRSRDETPTSNSSPPTRSWSAPASRASARR